jgi:hypothetical protein
VRCDGSRLSLLLLIGGAMACERGERPGPTFSHEPAAQPAAVQQVKRNVRTTAEGYRVADLHLVFLEPPTAAVARATLQHAIDSATAADSGLKSVRVVGFTIGTPDSSGTADVLPAISAVWAPVDTAALRTGRRVQFRTTFTILRPLALGPADTTPP